MPRMKRRPKGKTLLMQYKDKIEQLEEEIKWFRAWSEYLRDENCRIVLECNTYIDNTYIAYLRFAGRILGSRNTVKELQEKNNALQKRVYELEEQNCLLMLQRCTCDLPEEPPPLL